MKVEVRVIRVDIEERKIGLSFVHSDFEENKNLEANRKALRLDPTLSPVHNNLGAALAALGRTAEAIGHYEQSVRLDPRSGAAHYNLGMALLAAGAGDRALEHLRETVQVVADNPHINGIMINFLTPPPDSQALTLSEKEKIVAQAFQLKREGFPILNTDRALKEMLVEDFEEKCPYWVSGFVLPDRSHYYGCPMRGTKACKQCGFNAVREYYLITKGSPSVISQMSNRFAFSKK
jgi:tetratricopeptide (TPR) repeat protein